MPATRLVESVGRHFGPLRGVVAHSFGATATALALRRGLGATAAVFLAPPADLESYSHRFARLLHMPRPITESMKRRLVARFRSEWPEFRVADRAPSLKARLLVFHDRGDVRVPLRDGEAIVRAWPDAELVTTRGLGHHKILRDPEVLARAVAFLSQSEGREPWAPEDRIAAAS